MILYKYLSVQALKSILNTNRIGFSQARYFNDPFDTPLMHQEPKAGTFDEDIFTELRSMLKPGVWERNTAILSLTRSSTNLLMWSHYADMHRGAVIGIDVEEAGFTDIQTNFIPAQFGDIRYVSNRTVRPFQLSEREGLSVGNTYNFRLDHFDKVQSMFLQKPIQWAYEEEVRIVKCISDSEPEYLEKMVEEEVNDRPLFTFDMGEAALKEIYFGFRMEEDDCMEIFQTFSSKIECFECGLDPHSNIITLSKYYLPGSD